MSTLIKKILLPTDNSENSREAFQYAISLGEKYGSTIYAVYVVDMSYLEQGYRYESNPRRSPVEDLEENIVKEKAKETEEFIKKNTKDYKGLKIEKFIRKGKPFVEIIIAAREKEADLIVMGTHGRTGISHALMGSVAEKVVRKAPCPVLTIKPRDFEFKVP
jgi:nucleotide-binding universal stress UspA family protein